MEPVLRPSYYDAIYTFMGCVKRHKEKGGVLSLLPRDVALLIARDVKRQALSDRCQYRVFYTLLSWDEDLPLEEVEQVANEACLFQQTFSGGSNEAGEYTQTFEQFEIYDVMDIQKVTQHVARKISALETIFDCERDIGGQRGKYLLSCAPLSTDDRGIITDDEGDFYSFRDDTITEHVENTDNMEDWRYDDTHGLFHEFWFSVTEIKERTDPRLAWQQAASKKMKTK